MGGFAEVFKNGSPDDIPHGRIRRDQAIIFWAVAEARIVKKQFGQLIMINRNGTVNKFHYSVIDIWIFKYFIAVGFKVGNEVGGQLAHGQHGVVSLG